MKTYRFFAWGAVLWVIVTALCACESYKSGEEVSLDDFMAEFNEAICDYYRDCDLEWFWVIEREMTCEIRSYFLDDMFPKLIDSVKAGRMKYDGRQAHQCIRDFNTASCNFSEVMNDNSLCLTVFSGNVDSGDDCYHELECREGLYCDVHGQNCPGTCHPFKEIGEPCGSQEECDETVADCDHDTRTCFALGDEGDECRYSWDCMDSMVCNSNVEPRTCTQPLQEGEACLSEGDCLNYLDCVDGTCLGPGELGDICQLDMGTPEIWDEACGPGLYCDAEFYDNHQEMGTCQPKKEPGVVCYSFYQCESGLLCIDLGRDPQTYELIPGVCGIPIQVGETCTLYPEERQCGAGLYCDESTSTCKTRPSIGEPCTAEARCMGSHLFCDGYQEGVCQLRKMGGESCTFDDECWSYACSNGVCYPEPCEP